MYGLATLGIPLGIAGMTGYSIYKTAAGIGEILEYFWDVLKNLREYGWPVPPIRTGFVNIPGKTAWWLSWRATKIGCRIHLAIRRGLWLFVGNLFWLIFWVAYNQWYLEQGIPVPVFDIWAYRVGAIYITLIIMGRTHWWYEELQQW